MKNRSMPDSTVIPVLLYDDVETAASWLCGAFGFTLRWRAGGHRAQLNAGGGCVVIAAGTPSAGGHSIMVRVQDAEAHCRQAAAFGARVTAPPHTFPYGERQYSVDDLAGRSWTFSQSVADIDPASWGAEVGVL